MPITSRSSGAWSCRCRSPRFHPVNVAKLALEDRSGFARTTMYCGVLPHSVGKHCLRKRCLHKIICLSRAYSPAHLCPECHSLYQDSNDGQVLKGPRVSNHGAS